MMNRRLFLPGILATCFGLLAGPRLQAAEAVPAKEDFAPSMAYKWMDILLDTAARDVDKYGARPPILARAMAIVATGMFDAWAAYDAKAIGTRLGDSLRRPEAERTRENQDKAVSFAAYRTLCFVYSEQPEFCAEQFAKLGFDPRDDGKDPATPAGIGNLAAQAVIDFRKHDGSNQDGSEQGGDGKPYSDYTYYRAVNPKDKIVDPDRWQPIEFESKEKGKHTPGFLVPHWYKVIPFGLASSAQFRPGPPPKINSDQLRREADEVLACNATLSNEQKALIEFMRDGPRSTGQSGHWLRLAQAVSRRDHNDLNKDVKMYFAVANGAMDSFIASWETKRFYDSSRPWTMIHYYYNGQDVTGWRGPGKGVGPIKGEDWHPYSPLSFITPPFPGYVSGHSCVSATCSKLLEFFTGSDQFGEVEVRPCCMLTETIPGSEVSLKLNTFTETADLAGLSRVLGGYHIQSDNIEGLKLGRKVAEFLWPKIRHYYGEG